MPQETWTIKRCLDWTSGYLGKHGDERPRLSGEWLLSSITGMSRTELYMRYDRPLDQEELAQMHQAVARRAKGEPLQYITGEAAFRTITVACEPGVLIPRPETEMLVEEVLTFLDREVLGEDAASVPRERAVLPWNDEVEAARRAEEAAAAEQEVAKAAESEGVAKGDVGAVVEEDGLGADAGAGPEADSERAAKTGRFARAGEGFYGEAASASGDAEPADAGEPRVARVLEVGCGTGCIALSLVTERPGRVVCVSTDIEPKAVALADRNREALGIAPDVADFREGNLVSPLARDVEWGTFDVLVSNPPYVPTAVMATLPREVADYEPALALEGGEDGLDIFRRLLKAAPFMLRKGGLFACELHEESLDAAAELCRSAGMSDVRVVNDLANRPRIILARTTVAAAREG